MGIAELVKVKATIDYGIEICKGIPLSALTA